MSTQLNEDMQNSNLGLLRFGAGGGKLAFQFRDLTTGNTLTLTETQLLGLVNDEGLKEHVR